MALLNQVSPSVTREIVDLLRKQRRERIAKSAQYPQRTSLHHLTHGDEFPADIPFRCSSRASRESRRSIGRKRSSVSVSQLIESQRQEENAAKYGRMWRKIFKNHQEKPIEKFRRVSRAMKMLILVCINCRESVVRSISGESWFSSLDAFAGIGAIMSSTKKKHNPFVTLVSNDRRELVELRFDASQFSRESGAEHLLTDEIKASLLTPPSERKQEELYELVVFFKKFSISFNTYTLDTQRKLVKCMWYDRYQPLRVITKAGGQADGVYFLLSGTLTEKYPEKRQLRDITSGEKFGEEELVCACPRKSTIVTKTYVELITIHRSDFRAIFNMSADLHNPKYLELCKKNVVLKHFPIIKLIENPSVWTVLSYKFGRLMVKDSNDMEWLYIIVSGEARVIKHLSTKNVDIKSRRSELQARIKEDDPFQKSKQIINFVADEVKSSYSPDVYKPSKSPRMSARSAPPGRRHELLRFLSLPANRDSYSAPTWGGSGELFPHDDLLPRGVTFELDSCESDQCSDEESTPPSNKDTDGKEGDISINDLDEMLASKNKAKSNMTSQFPGQHSKQSVTFGNTKISAGASGISETGRYLATPGTGNVKLPALKKSNRPPDTISVPPFVQLETLNSGQVFGLRSCLVEEEDRGPSVSLVSAKCEVLQINKKFFLKHVDDAILSLIKVTHKPFPQEEDLIDRMDANIQWEEFKQNTVIDYVKFKGKPGTSYNMSFSKV